jgi:osmotically-inducible protein OsmY
MTRLIPTLCLSGLLLACARDAKHEESAARAETSGDEQRGAAEARSEQHAERDETPAPRDADERVELKHRGDRGRVASSEPSVPAQAGDARAREVDPITPMDQGNGEIDLELTQRIRKSVVGDDSLSFGAKNVKIITRDGHVTLRGTVNSAAEKDAIFKTAVSHAGVGHVTNQLEVDND